MNREGFSTNETIILNHLWDGQIHKKEDIMKELDPDGLMTRRAFTANIERLNRKLAKEGRVVIAQFVYGRCYYRLMRLHIPERSW